MSTVEFKAIKKLKEISTRKSSLTGLLMDIVYFGTSFLIMQGVSLIPARANAFIIVLLVYIFHYLYRYVFIWKIGECGRPLHVQSGIKLPRFLKYFFNGVFILSIPMFPILLIIFCMEIFIGFDDQTTNPLLWSVPFFTAFPLLFVNILIYLDQYQGNMPENLTFFPEPSFKIKKLLTGFFIPVLSIVSGCSLSIVSYLFAQRYPAEPSAMVFASLTAFIPFRYLVMRTAGASLISAASFIISVVLIIAGHLTEIFTF